MPQDRDDDLAVLRTALEVDPSPAFTAGVRRRIEQERAQTWRPSAVGVAAIAGLAAALIWLPWSQREAPPSSPRIAPQEVSRVAPPPDAPRGERRPPATAARAPERSTAPRSVRTTRDGDDARREPHVLIARDEARAFSRLLVAVRMGQVGLPADDDLVKQAVARAIEGPQPTPIVHIVVPLEIEPYPELEN